MWIETEDIKDFYRAFLIVKLKMVIDRHGLLRWDNGCFIGSVGFRKIIMRYYNCEGVKLYEE
jgi:hypothetical protein